MSSFNIGDKVKFVVPTGNFGNVLAGYFAARMGLPVDKLVGMAVPTLMFDFDNLKLILLSVATNE
jgi:threonine synthase